MKAPLHYLSWLLLLGILAGAPRAFAKNARKLATADGSGVEIEVSCDFDNGVTTGALPIHFTVHNNTGRSGTWLMEVDSNPYGEGIRSTVPVSLEAGQSRTVFLAAPLTAERYNNLTVRASGPGATDDTERFPGRSGGGANGSTQFLLMSRELSMRSWEPLKKEIEGKKKGFNAAQCEPADLAPDWRGFAGVDWFALTDGEWTKLAPDVRAAIRQWVAQGGRLVLVAQDAATVRWDAFHLGPGAGPQQYGFGEIRAVAWDGKELGTGVLAPLITTAGPRINRQGSPEGNGWSMRAALGSLKPNVALILFFVGGFALLVGPVNLFVFAPAARRHRMFWTTPVIAIGGSLVLMAVILLQEGTGGSGRRFSVIRLLPESHEAIVRQEQVVRTGLLFDTGFRLAEEALVTPIPLDGVRDRRSRMEVAGTAYSGDWFRSRSLQAQSITSVRPTRAVLTVVGVEPSGAPVIVSSIESPLKTVLVTDENGKAWTAERVRTGEKTVLKPVKGTAFDLARELVKPARPLVCNLLIETKALGETPGTFVALVTEPKEELLPTLPGIRWKEDQVVYLGPVVKGASTQTGGPQP